VSEHDSAVILPSIAELTALVSTLLEQIKTQAPQRPGNELMEGLVGLDELLDAWLDAAKATNIVAEELLSRFDDLEEQERAAMLLNVDAAGAYQAKRAYRLLRALGLWQLVPYAGDHEYDRVRHLFAIYGDRELQEIQRLTASRHQALTVIFDEVEDPQRRVLRKSLLKSSIEALAAAQDTLRDYIRVTFPAALMAPTHQHIYVSGGIVGNIGPGGTSYVNRDPAIGVRAAGLREQAEENWERQKSMYAEEGYDVAGADWVSVWNET
jgi:hypothetical protein